MTKGIGDAIGNTRFVLHNESEPFEERDPPRMSRGHLVLAVKVAERDVVGIKHKVAVK